MNKDEFKVTIPSLAEMHEVNDYLINHVLKRSTVCDFAMANGAHSIDYLINSRNFLNLGPTWTRNAGRQAADKVMAVEASLEHRNLLITEHRVKDATVSVMPRFQNPRAQGFGMTNLRDQRVLTIDGKVAYWPQPRVASFVERINSRDGVAGINQLAGCVATGKDFMGFKCYQYQGENYVVMPYNTCKGERIKMFADEPGEYLHFADGQEFVPYRRGYRGYNGAPLCFRLQPVRVMPCADGSIQCLDALFPAALGDALPTCQAGQEFDPNALSLGHYLNNGLVTSLQQSTELEFAAAPQKLSRLDQSFLLKDRIGQRTVVRSL